jgi:hypothetical protein
MDQRLPPLPVEDCIAIASGARDLVDHWGQLLRKARISFELRWSCEEARPTGSSQTELWVIKDKADGARSIIRGEAGADESLLW